MGLGREVMIASRLDAQRAVFLAVKDSDIFV